MGAGACRVCGAPLRETSRFPQDQPAAPKRTARIPAARPAQPPLPPLSVPPDSANPWQTRPAAPQLLWRRAREENAPRLVAAAFWPGENAISLVLVPESGALQFWDEEGTGHSRASRWALRKPSPTTCAVWVPPGQVMATGDEAGRIHRQRLEPGGSSAGRRSAWQPQTLDSWEAHRGRVLSLAATESHLLSGGSDGAVVLTRWPDSNQARTPRPQLLLDGFAALSALAASPSGSWLALGGDGGEVQLWRFAPDDIAAQRAERVWASRRESSPVKSLAFAPNGQLLASCHARGQLRLWAAHTGYPLPLDAPEASSVTLAAFAPDSRLLALSCDSPQVNLFDAWTGTWRCRLPLLSGRVQALAFSPATPTASGAPQETLLAVATAQETSLWKVAL